MGSKIVNNEENTRDLLDSLMFWGNDLLRLSRELQADLKRFYEPIKGWPPHIEALEGHTDYDTVFGDNNIAGYPKRPCCYLDGAENGCPSKAEYQVWHGEESTDFTESCAVHLGVILDDSCESFRVLRIPPAQRGQEE